jgi:Tol biopolymer transport system component
LPSGQHGVAYSTDVTGTGGLDDAYHWEVVAGALPDGLTLAAAGAPAAELAGTPTVNGSFAFTVRLSTPEGTRVERALRLDVRTNPPQLAGKTLTAGSWGEDYADAITGTSRVGGAVQWKIIDGWLPPGVELEATTSTIVPVRGRPKVSGPFEFTLQMTDPGGVAQASFHVDIGAINPFQLIGRTLPRGRVGDAYAAALQTRNAVGDVSWRIAGDELPPGVVLQSDGPRAQLVGTPTTAGFYRFTVEATADGHVSNRHFAMLVRPVTSWALAAHGSNSDGPYAVSVVDVTTLPTTPVVVKDGLRGWVGDLTVSPDGRYATFTSGDLDRKSLYLVDLRDGPHPAVLLTTSLRGDRGLPVDWSPDGAFAIVPVQVADFEYDMHMLDGSGASPSFRSLGIARAEMERAWAPDGNSVAFASPRGDIVYIATRSGSSWSTRAIPTAATALWPLRWLPDASGLLFSANGTNQGLFFVDPSAAAPLPMRLTRPRVFYNPNLISATEDGTRIILTDCCGGFDENRTIWVFDTSRQAFAQAIEMTGGAGGPVAASWSPDSRHLLVIDESSRALHIVDADTPPTAPPAPLQVTGLDGPLQTVAWTPDGLSLLATTNTAVYRIPVFATPEADRLLGGFLFWPRTWFLGAHSPFVFIEGRGLQAIDLSIPADQRVALRVDTVGSGNHYFREDPMRERVYYSDLAVDHHSLYLVDVSGPLPVPPVELLRVPFLGNEAFSD